MNKKIIFAAGGTGGHIIPTINLMKHFSERGYEVLLVTDKRGEVFTKNYSKFKTYLLRTGTPTNKNFIKKIISYFVIFFSVIHSIIILKKEKPDLVIGLGGYVSFPISFTSKFFNLPLVIYECNIVLGRTNKYLLQIAKKIFLAHNIQNFPEKYKNKSYETGTILDKKIINNFNFKEKANNNLSILVLGGSQGAEIFGRIVPTVIKKIKDKGYNIEINQQCTQNQKKELEDYYKKNSIKNYLFEFDPNILKLTSSSHLAISRCGASTIAELAHTFTPFIAIPLLNSIDNHQYLNAKFYESLGCCWILEEKNFNTENLFNLIIDIIKDKNKLTNMKSNMKKISNNLVYEKIESQIIKLIQK